MPATRTSHRRSVSSPSSPSPAPKATVSWIKLIAICVCLVAIALIFGRLFTFAQNLLGEMHRIDNTGQPPTLLFLALVLYAMLIALPFMPGIEVGVAILMIEGAQSAPFVYIATVAGLMTAYLIGRFFPMPILQRTFARMGLKRASAFVGEICNAPPEERLAKQRALLPKWLGRITVDYRYVAIGILLNVPGTFAIGGGGGILLVAGLSRLFNGWLMLLTLMIATLPVPLTVWIMGTQIFSSS